MLKKQIALTINLNEMLAATGFNKTDDDNSPFFTEKIKIPYVEPNSTTEGESYKISSTERELTFFKHTGELLSSRMIDPDIKSRLEKKKKCENFITFLSQKQGLDNVNEIESSHPRPLSTGDNLEWLLPFITLYEQVEAEQYTEIDNFLMPIWKFNNFTAKEIFKEQSQEYTQKYIIQIINNKINESELSEMSTMLKQSPVFNDRASEELVGSLKKNIKEMHNVFFKDTKSELTVGERGQLKQSIINAIIGPDNDTESGNNSLSFYQRLFIDFFRGCIYEKRINDPQEDNLHHRINSGGCKLMVQGASGILGIEDPFKLIDKLVIDKDKLSSTEEETRDKWKQKLNNLLTLQAEANIHFNDAISLPKEIQNKELSIADVKKIYGEMSPIEWLDDKLDQYKTCLIKYTREMTELLMDIYQVSAQKPGDKDPALTDLERYIQLISSALIGVPFWSCKLTSRYMIQQLVADINQIKEKIDILLKTLCQSDSIIYSNKCNRTTGIKY